ncbi:flavin-dependent monooxygenase QhpG [Acaryochloris marina]|uniref:Tryptophan halogenase, putative n=1 Tax=Acaryochloris marina (strain MBIC 11017) TaxID=329726 RepID=B0C5X8_ACAM1|nr:NAD(P)/FAD-dependent oxidoreductase [Acaryochloris marina]ABW29990.1 tryptophan halogenase, putative [Acaryochloris marina MBIC11017]
MGTKDQTTFDVCVIGGGPAGSVVSHRLASLGYKVCIIESQKFPRPNHIGASLLPSTLPLLDCIGVRESVENTGFLLHERTIVWWSETFPIYKNQHEQPGFHVDRGQFDQLLLQNAKENGVEVHQPAHAFRPERIKTQKWQIRIRQDGMQRTILSKIVVDASGGRSLVPGRRILASAPLLALYAYWKGTNFQTIEARIEAGESEWFWYAPLSQNKAVTAVFLDPSCLSLNSKQGIENIYHKLLNRFRLFPAKFIKGIEGKVKICDASTRYAENPIGDSFIRIGDACLCLDPLSSQGIQSAVASGLQAAIIINTFLKYPEDTELAISFYNARQKEKRNEYITKTASFYQQVAAVRNKLFWHQRATFPEGQLAPILKTKSFDGNCKIQLSDHAYMNSTPIIEGNRIISKHALYHDMLSRPIAFVGGVEIVPLLRKVSPGTTIQDILQVWSKNLPVELSYNIMAWLWIRKIIVPFHL